jgi:predicted N-acetyltransferase YhbS
LQTIIRKQRDLDILDMTESATAMQIRTINWPQDRPAILEHIRLVHGPGDSDLLEKWYGTMPGFHPSDCFVIDGESGEIAAHTMLIPRAIQFGDSVLPAAEVGVVGTLDTYRGRGYATALMNRALERMAERGDAVSVIFGIPNFYERWGYEYAVGLYLTSYESGIETELALKAGEWNLAQSHQRRLATLFGIRSKPIVVRPFASDDLPAVTALYYQAAARGHSIFARDERTWRWQLGYMADIGRHDANSFLVAEHEDRILAYMRVASAPVNWFRSEDTARFSIIEFAGDDADATDALLAEAAAMARDYDAERIGLFVHPQSALMEQALARGATLRSFTGAGFLRLNDPGLALGGMANTFQSRLSASPFASLNIALRLLIEQTSTEIALEGSGGSQEVIELAAPAVEMIQLFSGWFGLDNLTTGGYDPRHREILKVLFPRGNPKIAIADLI